MARVTYWLRRQGEIGSNNFREAGRDYSIEEISTGVLDQELKKVLEDNPDFETGWWEAGFSNCGWNLRGLVGRTLEEFIKDKTSAKRFSAIKDTEGDLMGFRFSNDKLLGETREIQYGLFFYRNSEGENKTLHVVSQKDGERDFVALSLVGLKDVLYSSNYEDVCEISAISRRVKQYR